MLHCKEDSLPEHERMIVKHENESSTSLAMGKSIKILTRERLIA
jgi:hypothetical protein